MTPEAMADLHARAFAGRSRSWTADEFVQLLQSGPVFVVTGDQAFAMGRVVAGEAELLTIARAPEKRGQGVGSKVLSDFEVEACKRGAVRLFLEVGQDNTTAIRLYSGSGYAEVARRAAYYTRPDGAREDAIVMEKRSL
ncbi:GNAT family N-acetyltransferase [Roseovarius aestuariivivens]|uniref:GNAT family N-acetyltransferase n=1 Tax=Roseovarius aestuariivivens TaxID=1888910 RepID=UPI001081E8D6|nr:GNAT family N-acetyltransferase [Roseovarius aestuariivivens]